MSEFNDAREEMGEAFKAAQEVDQNDPSAVAKAREAAQDAALNYAVANENAPDALKVLDAAITAELGPESEISEAAEMAVTEDVVKSEILKLTEGIVAMHPEEDPKEVEEHLNKAYTRFYTNITDRYEDRYSDDEISAKAMEKLKNMVHTGQMKHIPGAQ